MWQVRSRELMKIVQGRTAIKEAGRNGEWVQAEGVWLQTLHINYYAICLLGILVKGVLSLDIRGALNLLHCIE